MGVINGFADRHIRVLLSVALVFSLSFAPYSVTAGYEGLTIEENTAQAVLPAAIPAGVYVAFSAIVLAYTGYSLQASGVDVAGAFSDFMDFCGDAAGNMYDVISSAAEASVLPTFQATQTGLAAQVAEWVFGTDYLDSVVATGGTATGTALINGLKMPFGNLPDYINWEDSGTWLLFYRNPYYDNQTYGASRCVYATDNTEIKVVVRNSSVQVQLTGGYTEHKYKSDGTWIGSSSGYSTDISIYYDEVVSDSTRYHVLNREWNGTLNFASSSNTTQILAQLVAGVWTELQEGALVTNGWEIAGADLSVNTNNQGTNTPDGLPEAALAAATAYQALQNAIAGGVASEVQAAQEYLDGKVSEYEETLSGLVDTVIVPNSEGSTAESVNQTNNYPDVVSQDGLASNYERGSAAWLAALLKALQRGDITLGQYMSAIVDALNSGVMSMTDALAAVTAGLGAFATVLAIGFEGWDISAPLGKIQGLFANLFPFCLVTDIANFASSANVGSFDWVVVVPLSAFGIDGVTDITFDLTPVRDLGGYVRPSLNVLFVAGLLVLTRKIFLNGE